MSRARWVIRVPQVSRGFLQPDPGLSPEETLKQVRRALETKRLLREAREKRLGRRDPD